MKHFRIKAWRLFLKATDKYLPHRFKNLFYNQKHYLKDRYKFRSEIDSDNIKGVPVSLKKGRKLNIVHYIGQLGAGGAERQFCNQVVRLHEMGHTVTALTICKLEGANAHYINYLTDKGIPVRMAEPVALNTIIKKFSGNTKLNIPALKAVPGFMSPYTYALVNELSQIQPDALHCWLDYSNVIGGIAGFITAVPKIFLGGRNVNPSHFKWMDQPWFKEWYDILILSKRIVLLNNSKVGAADYAEWLGISPSLIHVVPNAVNPSHFDYMSSDKAAKFRLDLNIPDKMHLIGGVFRLSSEKCPLDFIRVIKQVKETLGDVMAVVAGIGPFEKEMKQGLKDAGLEETIILLGRRTDVFNVIKACDVIVLASDKEGTPNSLMEAQYLGVPVVATRAGGTPEIMLDGVTGSLHLPGDIESLAKGVIKVLTDKPYARRLGENGQKFIKKTFSIDKMTEAYLNLYW